MYFKSTRDTEEKKLLSAQVIKQGLADDGGLFIPTEIPELTESEVKKLATLPYPERAALVMGKFLTDFTYDELIADCEAAYAEASFPGGAAPVVNIEKNLYSLELWHGPTAAFKDMALQLMPRLLVRSLRKTGENRTALILVATSGDTGKAALEGYRDVDGVKIMVFYPVDGVSRVQKLQMATQQGSNVNVCAINGNFDDAQTGVKKIFSDTEFAAELDKNGYFLSSANSINWGRLAPQIVYYVSAYCDLMNEGKISYGDKINVCVPTGNFGNILAAYIAKLMGLPIDKLICASNVNNVLTEFLRTGTYDRNRKFHVTMSPSMDILISSNLERLLAFVAGPEKTAAYMKSLNTTGAYTVEPDVLAKINESFVGYYTDEAATGAEIKANFENLGYLHDTHTVVAVNAARQYEAQTGDVKPTVIASTASPYKFAADVLVSLGGDRPADDLEALDKLSALTNTEITSPLRGLGERAVRFTETIDPADMPAAVKNYTK